MLRLAYCLIRMFNKRSIKLLIQNELPFRTYIGYFQYDIKDPKSHRRVLF